MLHSNNDKASKAVNVEYYHEPHPGRMDYWKFMAAPRFRMRIFLNVMSKYSPKSIVDLGCGSGELLREIKDEHPNVELAGVDLSETQIDINRRRYSSIDWHVIDLDKAAPIPDKMVGEFDLITASELIEHVEHPQALLQKACAMAKPESGILMLSTQSGKIWETERRVGHKNHFSVNSMEELLSQNGWEPIKIWNAGFPFHNMAKFCANLWPTSTMHSFNDIPYGLYQKSVCYFFRILYLLNSKRSGSQLFAVARRKP